MTHKIPNIMSKYSLKWCWCDGTHLVPEKAQCLNFVTIKLVAMEAMLLFLGGVGAQEILLIGTVVLVLFGAKKIPEFMKGLGKGVREFKDGVREIQDHVEKDPEPPVKKTE